jgi:hypothetical protein
MGYKSTFITALANLLNPFLLTEKNITEYKGTPLLTALHHFEEFCLLGYNAV